MHPKSDSYWIEFLHICGQYNFVYRVLLLERIPNAKKQAGMITHRASKNESTKLDCKEIIPPSGILKGWQTAHENELAQSKKNL